MKKKLVKTSFNYCKNNIYIVKYITGKCKYEFERFIY